MAGAPIVLQSQEYVYCHVSHIAKPQIASESFLHGSIAFSRVIINALGINNQANVSTTLKDSMREDLMRANRAPRYEHRISLLLPYNDLSSNRHARLGPADRDTGTRHSGLQHCDESANALSGFCYATAVKAHRI